MAISAVTGWQGRHSAHAPGRRGGGVAAAAGASVIVDGLPAAAISPPAGVAGVVGALLGLGEVVAGGRE
jgi:hypothetical protein